MRRGSTLIEAMAACFLVGLAMMLSLQFFHAAAMQRRATNERITASAEAANIIDRVTALPWNDSQKITSMVLSPEASKVLPQGAVIVEVADASGSPDAKRICVRVQWQPDLGDTKSEVHLVAWKYRGS